MSGRLAARLRGALERIRGWRRAQGRVELTRLLARVIEESGLADALRATGEFRARQAAIGKLVDLARAYEEERGPALHGFLARLEALEASGGVDAVPDNDEGDDAVAILTMHKAKGLEFPVVVLPALDYAGARGDRLGQKIRIGPDWVGTRTLDAKAWSQRDSVARRLLEQTQKEAERAEEMRILYVALTRAKERLVLIGTPNKKVDGWLDAAGRAPAHPSLTAERLRKSRTALEWIAAALAAPGATLESIPLSLERHAASDVPIPEVVEPAIEGQRRRRRLRPPRPPSPEAAVALDAILERASRVPPFPPFAALEGLRGKYWVTELKSLADAARRASLRADDGAEVAEAPPADRSAAAAPAAVEEAKAAARRGILYHSAISRLDLRRVSPEEVGAQMAAFATSPWWEGAPRDLRLETGIARFFAGEVGRRLQQAALSGRVEREVPFTLRLPVTELLPILSPAREAIEADARWRQPAWRAALEAAWVIVQGRIDCVFREEDGRWHLVDWKTDRVDATGAAARAAAYSRQMQIYRQAVSRLWGTGGEAWLVFLAAGEAVPIAGDGPAGP